MSSEELTAEEIEAIRSIMDIAFGDGEDAFAEEDWLHALGGRHFILEEEGEIVTHASVVERELRVGDLPVRTGYVEAVATRPTRQGRGFGTRVMQAVTAYVHDTFDLGALGTGRHSFYQRLGWQTWRGPAYVRTGMGPTRTPEDEGYILVLRTPTSPPFDGSEAISCDPRVGENW